VFAPEFDNFMTNGVYGKKPMIWYQGRTRLVKEALLARTLQKGN
jgi:hypothetical protein